MDQQPQAEKEFSEKQIAFYLITTKGVMEYLMGVQLKYFNQSEVSNDFEAKMQGITRVQFDKYFGIIKTDAEEYQKILSRQSTVETPTAI